MAFCTNCGNKVDDGVRFCNSCGAEISGNIKPQSPAHKPLAKEDEYTPEGRKIIKGGPKPTQNYSQRSPAYTPHPKEINSKKGYVGCLIAMLILAVILTVGGIKLFKSAGGWFDDLFSGNKTEQLAITDREIPKTQALKTEKVKTEVKGILAEQRVSTDSIDAVVQVSNNMKVILPVGLFEGEEELVVKELAPVTLPFDGRKCTNVVDISLGNLHEFDDYVEIQLDPPAGFDTQNGVVQCYTQRGKKWEQVLAFYDSQIGKVRTFTDHFTMFAYTYKSIKLTHNPLMEVAAESAYLWGRLTSTAQVKLLEGYDSKKIMQQQDDDYLAACWNSAMELYGLESAGLSFAENVLEVSDLGTFNNYVGNIGFGLALVGSAMDLQRGNKKKAVLETLKNTYNFGASKIINTRSLNIAFIGVFAIDYALTTFANEAWAGRTDLYRKMFDNFNYQQRVRAKKNFHWWKKEIFWRMEDKKDASKFEEVVEGLIQEYIQDFWDDYSERAIMQAELQKHGWTYDGGYSEKLKTDLNKEFRLYILQYIQPLIERMQLRYLLNAKSEIQNEAAKLADLLNEQHSLKCLVELGNDEEPENYKGFKVAFKTANKTFQKLWQGVLDEDATMEFPCTYAGFMDAGMPQKAVLYIPINEEKDEFEEVEQSFTIKTDDNSTDIIFSMDAELADGPWEISEYEASELFSFMNDIVDLALGSEETQKQAEEENAAKRRSAIRKLNEEYKRTKELGKVNAPNANYEAGEELLYLYKFNPEKERGLYTFTINEDDCETRVLLDLKSNFYFEAKMFTICDGFVWIDYLKGELKR
ncbi:zinc-ribbon domain-containing protein [Sunxiuqinia sp. A32]|uniref:zinc-ribbon domain-containing protein n=1 Tax=Sunxiuqinia sp. A32 TaxID=3461496 RepID=UPI0040467C0F